jgi:hypothetical protein
MKYLNRDTLFYFLSSIIVAITVIQYAKAADPTPPTVSRELSIKNQGQSQLAVEANLETVALDLVLDSDSQTGLGHAKVTFSVLKEGFPFLLLDAKVRSLVLDGEKVDFKRVNAPGTDATELLVLLRKVGPGASHILTVDYVMHRNRISFSESGVRFETQMRDTQIAWRNRRHYFEPYGPTGFESDQYSMTLHLSLQGVRGSHRIFANGNVRENGRYDWTIEFPATFTSSSFYIHVTDSPLSVVRTKYKGLERDIDLVVYSDFSWRAKKAARALPGLFEQFERDFGPYAHDSFIVYLPFMMFGGMEHAGAAVTTGDALGHELLHSWFGRCVSPSDGRSGWVDEALVSWIGQGAPRYSWPSERKSVNLGGFSEFERFAPKAVYRAGPRLIGELDALLASSGGMRAAMRDLYTQFKCTPITTEIFQKFLEDRANISLEPAFKKYVLGE